jgi:hypothetical protein
MFFFLHFLSLNKVIKVLFDLIISYLNISNLHYKVWK